MKHWIKTAFVQAKTARPIEILCHGAPFSWPCDELLKEFQKQGFKTKGNRVCARPVETEKQRRRDFVLKSKCGMTNCERNYGLCAAMTELLMLEQAEQAKQAHELKTIVADFKRGLCEILKELKGVCNGLQTR